MTLVVCSHARTGRFSTTVGRIDLRKQVLLRPRAQAATLDELDTRLGARLWAQCERMQLAYAAAEPALRPRDQSARDAACTAGMFRLAYPTAVLECAIIDIHTDPSYVLPKCRPTIVERSTRSIVGVRTLVVICVICVLPVTALLRAHTECLTGALALLIGVWVGLGGY